MTFQKDFNQNLNQINQSKFLKEVVKNILPNYKK